MQGEHLSPKDIFHKDYSINCVVSITVIYNTWCWFVGGDGYILELMYLSQWNVVPRHTDLAIQPEDLKLPYQYISHSVYISHTFW